MDERKIESPAQRTTFEPLPLDSRSVAFNGAELRIDQPHAPASQSHASAPIAIGPVPTAPSGSQLLKEASLIFEGLRTRAFEEVQAKEAELSRRELIYAEQLEAFNAEIIEFQSRRAAEEAAFEERRVKLSAGETELVQRLTETRSLLAQIDSARQAVEQEQHELEAQRQSLREDVLLELQEQRQAAAAERELTASELEKARTLTASLEERLQEATVQAEKLIQSERERLWQTLIAEWEERRAKFQQEHDAWLATVEADRLEIEREKAFYEAAIRNAETEFEALREAQEAEINSKREQWGAAMAAEQVALRTEKEEWSKTRIAQLAELQGERAVLENRIRFQQEHLEKLRADLEKAQNEHRRDRQIERQQLEDDNLQLLRRIRQIDLYRAAVDEREKSLERERDVLEKTRRAMSSNADQDRLNLQREQSAWQSERQIQQAELLRQQELYSSHMDGLESRRIRLEKLRNELEDTHRSTLEMRLAVEEAWVELSQKTGPEVARERIEQARNALIGYYRELHESVVEQRREHLEVQTKFERARTEFHDERQRLMEWISSRDQELRVGEERLRLAVDEADTRDSVWNAARDRWIQEKAEAEQVIRKLLGELGNQHRDATMSLPDLADLLSTTSEAADSKPDNLRD